jgi:hypothetical protein
VHDIEAGGDQSAAGASAGMHGSVGRAVVRRRRSAWSGRRGIGGGGRRPQAAAQRCSASALPWSGQGQRSRGRNKIEKMEGKEGEDQ